MTTAQDYARLMESHMAVLQENSRLRDAFDASKQAQEPVAKCVTWTTGPNEWKDWCAQWFGPDADDDYLAKAVFALPPMAQNFKLTAPKQAEPAWQPIESAPKNGVEILLGHADGSCTVGYWGYARNSFNGDYAWCDGGTDFAVTWPTHWMPLPTPPEA